MKKLYNQIINSQLFRTIFDEQVLLIIAGLVVGLVAKSVPEFADEPWLFEGVFFAFLGLAGLRGVGDLLREFITKYDVAAIVEAVLVAFEKRTNTDLPDVIQNTAVDFVRVQEAKYEARLVDDLEAAG